MPQIHNKAHVLEEWELNNREPESKILCLQYGATSWNIGGTCSLTLSLNPTPTAALERFVPSSVSHTGARSRTYQQMQ